MEIENAVNVLKDFYNRHAYSNKSILINPDGGEFINALKVLINYSEKQQKINGAIFDASRIMSRN
tara:strand:+ start:3645 stop:3839 length:195 start_codon:yes stop_codon:yes gene_type:complete